LSDAGITSIGLVSDGISYSAANGEVQVVGSGSFTRADGSTGISADAIFTSSTAKATQEVERVAANSNNVALAAAVAAAGIVAAAPAAAQNFGDAEFSAITNAVVAQQSLGDIGLDSAYNSPAFDLGNAWDAGFNTSFQSLSSSSHTAIAASNIGDLVSNLSLGSAPTALLDATDFSAMMQVQMPSTTMSVAMPSADSLMPAMTGVAALQQNGAVDQIVADALHGGGAGPDLHTLVNTPPRHRR